MSHYTTPALAEVSKTEFEPTTVSIHPNEPCVASLAVVEGVGFEPT
jgi:hypothetical protein